jgi:predicted Abi (CAAX) family protease
MNKDLLYTLSTGDKVKNTKTGQEGMIVIMAQNRDYLFTIKDLNPPEDWELTRSRTHITQAELDAIAEYHRKLKEAAEGKKK